ncbi:MAG TPA: MMPL family transporter, partial [Gemmataceae bacterium]|nr:MMPL family transporter [Gemmataceae bacterium]
MRTEHDRGEEAGFLPQLLVRLANGVCRYPWLTLAVALAVCGLSIAFAWARLEFRTQRSDLVSPKKDFAKRWQQYLDEFGDDDDMVVVVQGKERARMELALETLAGEVRQQPKAFDRLFYKVDLRPLRNRALLFLPSPEIARIQDNLKSMSLLLEPPLVASVDPLFGWKQLTLAQLLDEGARRAAALQAHGLQPVGLDDEQLFTQLAAVTRSAANVLDDPNRYGNPWQSILSQQPQQRDLLAEPQYFFSGDNTLAFLLVRPIKDATSFTAAKDSVDALRALVAKVSGRFPDLALGLTGLPVLENDEMVASQNDSNAASWLALIGVALLYLVVFRSFRYPLLTVSALLVGTAWAMGWLTLTVGHLNILSATFAVMLIGMGDYGILWVTRYDQERCAGADVLTAMRATAASVGPGILTAAVTTALAFYAAMLADFQAIAELGWIAGSGVLLCALSCFLIMPALLKLTDRRGTVAAGGWRVVGENGCASPATRQPSPATPQAWLPALARRPRWVIGVSLSLTLLFAAFALRVRYDHNLLHLQAEGLDSVQWELKLIDKMAGASWHALSYTATPEEALDLKARYEKLPGVLQVVEVASLVPRDQEHKLEQLRDIQRRLRRLPERG